MKVETFQIEGPLLIHAEAFADGRGSFRETWNRRGFLDHGIDLDFVQDNLSCSRLPGTVRGLHFQAPPHAQAKLVRVSRGRILDVAVDFRRGSPSFGKWIGVELSAADGCQLLVPAGFLHGFVTREPDTEVVYKCSAYYAPASEGSVRFDDPDIDIDWDISPAQAILSEKDAGAPTLRQLSSPFSWAA